MLGNICFGLSQFMNSLNLKILLVEDDLLTQRTSKRTLSQYGEVTIASTLFEGRRLIDQHSFDVGFFDLNLNGELHGLDLISYAKNKSLYSVVVSGESDDTTIRSAFEQGAKDYLLKPFTEDKLDQVMASFRNSLKNDESENLIKRHFTTRSERQINELKKINNLRISDKAIFINGETGTGKRVVGHIIKAACNQKNFVELNCSQFNDELLASELFGHVKGAFTGATQDKEGLLSKAHNGIIFLDEIHTLSLRSQRTLLKAIEEKTFYPVGGSKPVNSNFRILSATCENIHELIRQGAFRQDLFARISTFQIKLLPLRERTEDILPLIQYFISKHLVQIYIEDESKQLLERYAWPRNTREIEDLVENWVVEGTRIISPDSLPVHIRNNSPIDINFIPEVYFDMIEEHGLNDFLTYLKKEIVTGAIKRNGGSMRKTALEIGASYSSLSTFLKQHKALNLSQGIRP